MNTTEVKFEGQIKNFEELYNLAKEQFLMYEKVEGIDDWEEYDFSIDCSEDQMKFKDIMQIRFIEELTEASIAMTEECQEHFWEEIGDAINFFLSGYVMAGIDFKKLKDPETILNINNSKFVPKTLEYFSLIVYPVIEKVGYLCNLLKNRPWAQSNYLVSLLDFDERVSELWDEFWSFLSRLGVNPKDVFGMVYKKYIVNVDRVGSGY